MNDIEIKEQLDDIVGMVAGDNYEGWEDYWEWHDVVVKSLENSLKLWEITAKKEAGK